MLALLRHPYGPRVLVAVGVALWVTGLVVGRDVVQGIGIVIAAAGGLWWAARAFEDTDDDWLHEYDEEPVE